MRILSIKRKTAEEKTAAKAAKAARAAKTSSKAKVKKKKVESTSSSSSSGVLAVGNTLDFNVYTSDGHSIMLIGDKVTKEDLTRITERDTAEMFSLNEKEAQAVEEYTQALEDGLIDDTKPSVKEKLDPQLLHQGDVIDSGIYLCGGASVYISDNTRALAVDEIESLKKLQKGANYAWLPVDKDNNTFKQLDSVVLEAIVHKFSRVEPEKKKKGASRMKKILAKVHDAERLNEHRVKRKRRPRTLKEKEDMTRFVTETVESLNSSLDGVGRQRTKLRRTTVSDYRQMIEDTIGQMLADKDLAANFLHHSDDRNFLVAHAFKVSMLTIELATSMGLSKRETQDLGLAAVIQDVGMNHLPVDVLNKKTPLTPAEMERIYEHPYNSAEIIEKSETVPGHITDVVIESHERLNGSGYPKGLKDDEISVKGKILSVANVYAALISPRPYRPAFDPYYAMTTLFRYAQHRLFDNQIVRKLVEALALFPVGTYVKLDSGEIARVASANEKAYSEPMVNIMLDAVGTLLDRPQRVDLIKDDRRIERTVEKNSYAPLRDLGTLAGV